MLLSSSNHCCLEFEDNLIKLSEVVCNKYPRKHETRIWNDIDELL